MNIYTGYYARFKHYIAAQLLPIAISRGVPDFCQSIDRLEMFQPDFSTLIDYKYKRITETEYANQYKRNILYYLDPVTVHEMLKRKYNDQNIVLLCYESPKLFCHRQLVAQWFSDAGNSCKRIRIKKYIRDYSVCY